MMNPNSKKMIKWFKRFFCKHNNCKGIPCYIGSVPTYMLMCMDCGKTLKDVPVTGDRGRK